MMAGLLAVVIVKASLVTRSVLDVQAREGVSMEVADRANQVLDRIQYQVMSCDYETLQTVIEEPNDTSGVQYRFALGLSEGEVVWSDSQEIGLEPVVGEVFWKEDAGGPDEREIVWTRWAREYLEDELPNGVDDNGNGLVDERGLSFSFDGPKVTIRLTLESHGSEDGSTISTFERTVLCRN